MTMLICSGMSIWQPAEHPWQSGPTLVVNQWVRMAVNQWVRMAMV